MVERGTPTGAGEMAAEDKRAGVPRNRVFGDGFVDMILDELLNAVVVEGDGGVHLVAAVKAAGTDEPVVALGLLMATGYKVLGNSVLAACLSEREIVLDGEILVQGHVIVQVLVAGDAG